MIQLGKKLHLTAITMINILGDNFLDFSYVYAHMQLYIQTFVTGLYHFILQCYCISQHM